MTEASFDLLVVAAKNALKLKRLPSEARAFWYSVLFLHDFENSEALVRTYFRRVPKNIWRLKIAIQEFSNPNRLSSEQLKFVASEFARRHKHTPHPTGTSFGDRNPWDASQFVRRQIDKLAKRSDLRSMDTLAALSKDPHLTTYSTFILDAMEQQREQRRSEEFVQPSWEETIGALFNGTPANIADLQVIAIEALTQINSVLRTRDDDPYKAYWNEEGRGGKVVAPKNEDSCRDRLLGHLRELTHAMEISAIPEGHMVADKRSDILMSVGKDIRLPIEIKRDYHDKLWVACENQLRQLYTRDPGAKGHGLYVVFWFGENRAGSIPAHPKGIDRPRTAQELSAQLNEVIPETQRHSIKAVVLDVSPP